MIKHEFTCTPDHLELKKERISLFSNFIFILKIFIQSNDVYFISYVILFEKKITTITTYISIEVHNY
jgi:hypothetical protein